MISSLQVDCILCDVHTYILLDLRHGQEKILYILASYCFAFNFFKTNLKTYIFDNFRMLYGNFFFTLDGRINLDV